ncbi:hypothetical protein GGS21DRAFT_297180 [Xylaria nigripes]|nr:hypothetical protein GGS21DRAFT_297180 [Xylaria nigripes]
MAINEDVPGLEAVIGCQNRPLEELDDPSANNEHDACPTTIKYIECIEGAEFDITVKVHHDYSWGYRNHILVARIYVDGEYIRGHIIQSTDYDKTQQCLGPETYSLTEGTWYRRNLKFAAVKMVDDAPKERVEKDLKIAKGLGTIEVRFSRAVSIGPTTSNGISDTGKRDLELAEKSLKGKAISHGTLYGSREAVRTPHFIQTLPLPEDNGSILKLIFLYRSREDLKRELIIPRSPSRSPTLANLSQAERDRLARERLGQLRDAKIKPEGNVVIKREFGAVVDLTANPEPTRPTKKSRLESGREVDVIDLTDD